MLKKLKKGWDYMTFNYFFDYFEIYFSSYQIITFCFLLMAKNKIWFQLIFSYLIKIFFIYFSNRCTATVAAVYWNSAETAVEGQLPQTSPALESKGVYNGKFKTTTQNYSFDIFFLFSILENFCWHFSFCIFVKNFYSFYKIMSN